MIRPAFLAACILASASVSCASGSTQPEASRNASEADWSQQEADEISQRCGAPAHWLKVINGQLQFQPDADGDYQVSVCILQALKESGKTKIGFVGNEAFRDDKGE